MDAGRTLPVGFELLLAEHAPGDRSWGERVRALPVVARRGLLDRADVDRDGDGRARVAAIAAYRALEADLDPSNPDDCERIMRLIDEGPAAALVRLMQDTELRAIDPDVGLSAGLVLAQREFTAGDAATAEERFRAALRSARGRHRRAEASAYLGYARFCLEQRRDVEAIILARRGSAAADGLGDALGGFFGRLVEAYVLLEFEDWPRLAAQIERLRTDERQVPSTSRRKVACGIVGIAADLAVGEGRFDDALRDILEAERLAGLLKDKAWSPSEVHLVRVASLAAEGRYEAARAIAEDGLATEPLDDDRAIELRTWCVELAARLGHSDLDAVAEEWLQQLEAASSADFGPGLAQRLGMRGGAALERVGGHPEKVRRAYRAAASGALTRLAGIERFVSEFPEFATPTADEADLLADHRRRTGDAAERLGDAVARLLTEEISAGRWPLASLAPAGGIVVCCAWCSRLRNREGLWLPLPETLHSLPQDIVLHSHGICLDCLVTVCPEAAEAHGETSESSPSTP